MALQSLRHALHECAETAGNESATAEILRTALREMGAELVADGLGGHGLLAKVGSGSKKILLRADMDALPMVEATGASYAAAGAHHACGHDGHMAMLLGALERLTNASVEVWALFQPAEEVGEGMLACLSDPAMDQDFDHVLAIHNVPGYPLGSIILHDGPAAVASTGIRFSFEGETSHAAEPEAGRNPIPAVSRMVPNILDCPQLGDEASVAALVEIAGGGPRFGTNAGDARVAATLRAGTDDALEAMIASLVAFAEELASEGGFTLSVERIEPFPATVNHAATVQALRPAFEAFGALLVDADTFPWSEDFGHATKRWPGALIGLGSGTDQPALHRPNYDFPDALLEVGINAWVTMVEALA